MEALAYAVSFVFERFVNKRTSFYLCVVKVSLPPVCPHPHTSSSISCTIGLKGEGVVLCFSIKKKAAKLTSKSPQRNKTLKCNEN